MQVLGPGHSFQAFLLQSLPGKFAQTPIFFFLIRLSAGFIMFRMFRRCWSCQTGTPWCRSSRLCLQGPPSESSSANRLLPLCRDRPHQFFAARQQLLLVVVEPFLVHVGPRPSVENLGHLKTSVVLDFMKTVSSKPEPWRRSVRARRTIHFATLVVLVRGYPGTPYILRTIGRAEVPKKWPQPSPAGFDSGGGLADRTRRHSALRLLPFLFLYTLRIISIAPAWPTPRSEWLAIFGFSDRVFGMGSGRLLRSATWPCRFQVHCSSSAGGHARVISLTMIAWGSMTALTALVHTPAQLYLARFFAGRCRTAFFPGGHRYFGSQLVRSAGRAKGHQQFHVCHSPLFFGHWIANAD